MWFDCVSSVHKAAGNSIAFIDNSCLLLNTIVDICQIALLLLSADITAWSQLSQL